MKSIVCTVTTDLTYDQRMARICGTLAAAGYEVRLVGRERPRSMPLGERPYGQIRLRNFFDRGKLFFVEHNLRVFGYLLTHRFDLVCGIDLDTILPCYLAAKIKGKPWVYDAHEVFTEIPELEGRRLVRAVWRALERFVVPRAVHAYTVNRSLVDLFRERYGASFAVIRNVPPLRPPVPAPEGPPYIFYQGVLNEGRGLEDLIRLMPRIDCRLLLAGEGDLSAPLRRLADDLCLEKKVEFLGFVEPKRLPSLTAGAWMAVNLRAPAALNDYYSLANKFFDYVHACVPQITMRFPEYERVNREFEVAILLEDLDPEGVAGAVRSLLGDRALHERLRRNCAKAREAHNWDREGKKLVDFYRKILGPPA